VLARLCLAADFTGAIAGRVTDPSGGLVPEAHVTATNDATGAVRAAVTAGLGEYVISQLPPGVHTVRAQKEGFRTAVFPKIEVRVDDTARLDATLDLGAIQEEQVVSGATPYARRASPSRDIHLDLFDELRRRVPLNAN
jgi:hypothetical protein